ncbi:10062_t:CDS:1, partial [Diversispora eburnea]
NEYSTKEKKEGLEEIIIDGSIYKNSNTIDKKTAEKLEGRSVDLSEYPNLEKLIIDGNLLKSKLTSLDLTNCNKLTILGCSRNELTSLDLSKNEKLEELYISDNNFFTQDLSFLSHLLNLKELCLGNYNNKEKINQGLYNRFMGSLKPLKNLTKLKKIDIKDTDISHGLEYLPDSVEELGCSVDERKDAQVQTIYNLFANEQGVVETDTFGLIKNFPAKLQVYKQKIQTQSNQAQTVQIEILTTNK